MSAHAHTLKPDLALVTLIAGNADKFKKSYCYPSQDWLCAHLARFAGRRMSRRTLNRHLGGLEAGGWIKRIRRHRCSPVASRGFEFRSTLYTLTRRAFRWLAMSAGACRRAVRWGRVTLPSQYIPLQGRVIPAGASGATPGIDRTPPDGGGSGTKPDTHLARSTLNTLREVLRHGR